MTNNISCDGFNFTFQNLALESGQRLEFKLNQPRTNTIVSFLGDVIWQEHKGSKYSAGVKFCDVKKKNKKVLLKIISESCNIPFNSLYYSHEAEKPSIDNIHNQSAPASDIFDSNKANSRILNRQRNSFGWLYRTIFILATSSAVLFLPAIIENIEDVSINSMALDNNKYVMDLPDDQVHDGTILALNNAGQFNVEVVEEDIPLTIPEKDWDLKLSEKIHDVAKPNKFHIQVASLKDSDIAYGILSKLKQDYPSAYLFIQNDFYKVRIPDIRTSDQGYNLLNNIEAKFNIKPILVKRFQ